MILNKYKILSISLLGILTIVLLSNFALARELEIIYPDLPGLQTPVSTKAFLPDYVKYIFHFSLLIAGLVAFGSLVYGGFRYLTSVGNPTAITDAKEQIFASILGLIILLCSFLILNTINPQLLVLDVELKPIGGGVILYKNPGCPGGSNPGASDLKPDDYMRVKLSLRDLDELEDKVGSIYFYEKPGDLKVFLYSKTEWDGTKSPIIPIKAGDCVPIAGAAKSIELQYMDTGVYFCKDNTKQECIYYKNSTEVLPKGWDDKITYVYFRNPSNGPNYGAVLHSKANFKGSCQLIIKDETVKRSTEGSFNNNKWASSITVFKQNPERSIGTGVIFYRNRDYNKETCKDEKCKKGNCNSSCHDGSDRCKCKGGDPFGGLPFGEALLDFSATTKAWDWGDSIYIDGNYRVLLFEKENFGDEYYKGLIDGECEIFRDSDPNLRDNRIEKCGPIYNPWGHGCFRSWQIISTK